MGDAEARFVINIDGGPGVAGATQVTSALEKLKAQIDKDTKALQELQAAAQRLKASADVIAFEKAGAGLKQAQSEAEKFGAKLKALRDAQEAMQKGESVDIAKFKANQNAIAEATKGLEAAKAKASGFAAQREKLGQTQAVQAYQKVTASIREKQEAIASAQAQVTKLGGTLTEAAEKGQGAIAKLGGLAGIVAIVAAIGVAIAAAVVSLVRFAIAAADAARSMGLFQEAATGSAEGAKQLDASIERVWNRVGGSRERIAGLALELRRAGVQGGALEATISSVSMATAAMGEKAGGIMRDLTERGLLSKRFVLQPLDLRGTGLAFKDVARELAKNMNISVGAAESALRNGQVRLEAGAKAMDQAVQAKFGGIVKKQMLSLPNQFAKFRDNLKDLFKNLNTEKLLENLDKLLSLFDKTTNTGKALRYIVTDIFGPMLDSANKVFPIVEAFIFGAIIAALDFTIAMLKVRNALRDAFGGEALKGIDGTRVAFEAGAVAAQAILTTVLAIGAAIAAAGAFTYITFVQPIQLVAQTIQGIPDTVNKALEAFNPTAWADAGANIVKGLIHGINQTAPELFSVITALGTGGLSAFATAIDSHSPSKLFEKKGGEPIGQGVAKGVENEKPRVSKAIAELGSPEPLQGQSTSAAISAGRGAAGSGVGKTGPAVVVHAPIYINGAVRREDIDKQSILEVMVEIHEEAARRAGLGPVEVVT